MLTDSRLRPPSVSRCAVTASLIARLAHPQLRNAWNSSATKRGTPSPSRRCAASYFTQVATAMGGAAKLHGSYRLFMAPGIAHCGGGEGPNDFAALEQWVEHGKAPDMIRASHTTNGKVDRTRPRCPYPQVATYQGSGSIDDAANFACR